MILPEMWKPISEFPDYEISNFGHIRSCRKHYKAKRLLKTPFGNHGYQIVKLYNNTGSKDFLVHRLVLTAFVGECPLGQEGCHKNGDKADNRLDNLRWETRMNNEHDKIALGRANIGERHGQSKLTDIEIEQIRSLCSGMKQSQRQLARLFGVSHQTINDVVSRKTWKHIP